MPAEHSEGVGAKRRNRAFFLYLTLMVAGCQIGIAAREWQNMESGEVLPGSVVLPLIAAVLLLVGLVAMRLPHVLQRWIVVPMLCVGAAYFVGPGTPYFDTLGIGHTPSVIDFPTVVVVGLYLLTPLLMGVLAFLLLKGLPVRPQPLCTESSFVHRALLDSESEWKPEAKPDTGEPVRMPAGLGLKLAAFIAIGTGIGFAISFPLNRKADAFAAKGWNLPLTPADEVHFGILHPVALFVGMFVVIAALWRVAAHRKMGRVLLGFAIGMQALLALGLFV